MSHHEVELHNIRNAGVDNMLLDFGVEVGDKMQQADYLPPEVIAALGRLGMGLIFSVVNIGHSTRPTFTIAGGGSVSVLQGLVLDAWV